MKLDDVQPADDGAIDPVPQHTGVVDPEWLKDHLNMEIALRAYEQGVADPFMGPAVIGDRKTADKLSVIEDKIRIQHIDAAQFPLNDDEIKEVLCLFPESWLQHARLKTVTVRPPAHFVTKQYGDHHFVAGIEDWHQGKKRYNGQEIPDGYYMENGLTPPASDFHYAPGQYMGSTDDILLFQEPSGVQESVNADARKQYGRELIVHEFLHAVLREDADLVFQIDGVPLDYASILGEFHKICQREQASTSEYSELYAPLLHRPFDLKDFWVKMGLQEELGELLSSTMLGWGATPKGEAKKPTERDFGGTAFKKVGKSEKVAFAEKLLTATVIKNEVGMVQGDIANRVNSATDTAS